MHPSAPAGIEFDWAEVNCFLRPQAMLCDEAAPGYGLLLVGLASLYRAWGVDGLFAAPGGGHFAFARSVYAPLTGIGFELSYVDDRDAVPGALRALLAQGAPVVVPANIRPVPWFLEHGREDKSHFFLVRGHDAAADRYDVLDYLHVRDDNLSLEYGPVALDGGLMRQVTDAYWEAYVGDAPTPDWDPRYWLLRVRPGPGFRPLPAQALLQVFLDECRRVLAAVHARPETLRPLDERTLDELRALHAAGAGGGERFSVLMQAYLQDANSALVYARVAAHALRTLGAGQAARAVEAAAGEYRPRAAAVRSRLLVTSMVAPSLPAAQWDAFRAELASLAAGFGAEVRAALAGGAGEGAPAPSREAPAPGRERQAGYAAPGTPTEAALAGFWAEVLGVERVGLDDRFVELGGNSLMAIRVAARALQQLGLEVPVRSLFDHPTLREFAAHVDELGWARRALAPSGAGAAAGEDREEGEL
ncbi:MAG TPA: phosphopantetheine-binding protein [Longimicrobium sp.]|jgi:acyl carrier protein|uniref:phosphopantetheine-binding protein n=1 Tax=Longimicrobium sp. TaxID=2029185 RepID=UPI002ED93850